jgi:hypothetical protein
MVSHLKSFAISPQAAVANACEKLGRNFIGN